MDGCTWKCVNVVWKDPMNYQNVSIIVVDDARLSCEVIRRALASTNYQDVRIANSATAALKMLHERPADVVLADWMMPEISGLELTDHIRQLDEDNDHYTYILLLTAKDDIESLEEAFSHGVDDFINKSPESKELLARVYAAGRIAHLQNTLLQTATHLTSINHKLEQQNSFDINTGLGNRCYLEKQLENILKHTLARGGGASCAVIKIADFDKIAKEYGEAAQEEITLGISKRLRQNIRPLDTMGILSGGEFGIVMHQPDPSNCHAVSFKRIFQAINLRTFKTQAGNIPISAAVCISSVESAKNKRSAGEILDVMQKEVPNAFDYGNIYEVTELEE